MSTHAFIPATLALAVSLAGCSDTPTSPSQPDREIQMVRDATTRYRDVANAAADGFVQAGPCVAAPGLGAMGFHYVNMARVRPDPVLQQPPALLYVPSASGLELVGVEYMVPVIQNGQPYTGQAPPSSPQPARVLFGRNFDGPSAPRSPGAPWQFELHVWVWRDNPAGRFAPFNPTASC